MRAGKAGVAQIGRAARENLFIRGLDVGVSTHDGADLAIKHPRKGDFFRSCFGVEIDEDDFGLVAEFFHFITGEEKRIFQRGLYERAPLKVEDGDPGCAPCSVLRVPYVENGTALPLCSGRVIQRAQKALLACEQFHHFLLVPEMIAAGDDIHAGGKDFLGGFGRDAGAASGVLAIGNYEVQRVLGAESGQEFLDRAAPGMANDVTDEEQFHALRLVSRLAMCNGQSWREKGSRRMKINQICFAMSPERHLTPLPLRGGEGEIVPAEEDDCAVACFR